MTPSPPLTSQPIIMSNSQENVEYVPISFGAFDAAPSSTGFSIPMFSHLSCSDESESNTNGSTNDVKKKYADVSHTILSLYHFD